MYILVPSPVLQHVLHGCIWVWWFGLAFHGTAEKSYFCMSYTFLLHYIDPGMTSTSTLKLLLAGDSKFVRMTLCKVA